MSFPPGTQLWVRCDDGVWWPAKVKELNAEMRAFLSVDEDCCVEFYHNPGELFPIVSSDSSRVCALHADPAKRTIAEAEYFANAEVHAAASKALRDQQRQEAPPLVPVHTAASDASTLRSSVAPPLPAATSPTTAEATTTPFSAAELRNIQALLDAVGPQTSSRLRQQLQRASVSVATRDVQRQESDERQTRKRQRAAVAAQNASAFAAPPTTTLPAVVQQWQQDIVPPLTAGSVTSDGNGASGDVEVNTTACSTVAGGEEEKRNRKRRLAASTAASAISDWAASAASTSDTSAPVASLPSAAASNDGEDKSDDALPFIPAARRRVVEVLRHEVFDNPYRFVLSPVYQFVEMLGAIAVENASLATALPSPRALREAPEDGFAPQRRVLLVPLTESYEHTTGWMVPTELDGVSLSMSLFINDTPVPLPPNWALSPAKEAAAVKTAMAVDVTELVLASPQDLFTLQVIFSGDTAEMEMWRGVIACVFVEEVGLARLGERIVSTYRKPRADTARRSPSHRRGDRGLVDMTEASVKLQCPITTLAMEIPVRSVHCEHLQCMELAAVLIQCVRQNVWNCPLCNAPMKPEDMWVNHRLRDWIASHPQQLSRVEYVVETPPGQQLKVVYREVKPRNETTVEVLDDDEEESST